MLLKSLYCCVLLTTCPIDNYENIMNINYVFMFLTSLLWPGRDEQMSPTTVFYGQATKKSCQNTFTKGVIN